MSIIKKEDIEAAFASYVLATGNEYDNADEVEAAFAAGCRSIGRLPVNMSELPLAVCRDADSDEAEIGGWLVLYENHASALADIDRRLILDFETIKQTEQWLAINLQMVQTIRKALEVKNND